MRLFIVTTKWSNEEGHDFQIELVTDDYQKAKERMMQEFNDAVEENEIVLGEDGYDSIVNDYTAEYWNDYGVDEFCVEITDRELNV